jgi:hypothetical protein
MWCEREDTYPAYSLSLLFRNDWCWGDAQIGSRLAGLGCLLDRGEQLCRAGEAHIGGPWCPLHRGEEEGLLLLESRSRPLEGRTGDRGRVGEAYGLAALTRTDTPVIILSTSNLTPPPPPPVSPSFFAMTGDLARGLKVWRAGEAHIGGPQTGVWWPLHLGGGEGLRSAGEALRGRLLESRGRPLERRTGDRGRAGEGYGLSALTPPQSSPPPPISPSFFAMTGDLARGAKVCRPLGCSGGRRRRREGDPIQTGSVDR